MGVRACAEGDHLLDGRQSNEDLKLGRHSAWLTILADQSGGMGGMMQDLAFAIPGVDEAMGFAEIMKCVPLTITPSGAGAQS